MNKEDLVKLEIEKRSLLEVVRQFTIHGSDTRMETGLDSFLTSIENKVRRIQDLINESRDSEIREIAHRMWLEAGSPDGEELREFFGKPTKLKDIHWHWATTEWTYGPDYLRGA